MILTLRATRLCYGYSLIQLANYLGISVGEVRKMEDDSSQISHTQIAKLEKLYNYSMDDIYIGPETECILLNRNRKVTYQ